MGKERKILHYSVTDVSIELFEEIANFYQEFLDDLYAKYEKARTK